MLENTFVQSRTKSLLKSRWFRRGVGITVSGVLVLSVVSIFLDEQLRRKMEKSINRDLKGYTVRLPKLHVRLFDLSLILQEMCIVQQAHPEPPVVYLPVLKASINWRAVFSGKLVAEFNLEQPKININLLQLRSERASKVSLKERGWQQAVENIYPLKINNLKVSNASITYIDLDQKKPLVLSHLNLQANNIRNINLPGKVYPSSFHLDAAIFETGRGSIDGNANFLAQPYPGIKGRVKLEDVLIDKLNQLSADSNLSVHGGLLGASGSAEFAPNVQIAHLEKLTIKGLKIDYIHSQRTAAAEIKRAAVVGKTAEEISNKPGLLLRADQVILTECTFGTVNKGASNPYRLFISEADLRLNNFSNHFAEGPATARLKGKFMGSGVTVATVSFSPKNVAPDLDLHLKIEDTQLTLLNELLRTYGNFDVSGGIFSMVTELAIKNNEISGYIKPFFKDVQIYDRRNDKNQGVVHQMYEMVMGGAVGLLENRSSQEVATKVTIKGSLKNPETSSWEVVFGLFKNAFFKALLPIFEKVAPATVKR